MAKPKQPCKNCGDLFLMPEHAVGDRVAKGWCTGCYNQWKRGYYKADERVYPDPSMSTKPGRGGYTSRPDWNAK